MRSDDAGDARAPYFITGDAMPFDWEKDGAGAFYGAFYGGRRAGDGEGYLAWLEAGGDEAGDGPGQED